MTDRLHIEAKSGIMEHQGDNGGNLKARFVFAQPGGGDILAFTGNDITQAWLDYVRPLVGELPRMGKLF